MGGFSLGPPVQQQRALRLTRGWTRKNICSVSWILKCAICIALCFLVWATSRLSENSHINDIRTDPLADTRRPSHVSDEPIASRSVERRKETAGMHARSSQTSHNTTFTNKTREESNTTTTVAYVATITSCGTDPNNKAIPFQIAEGAAVLRHSIARNQVKYDFEAFVMYHPDAKDCAEPLQDLGYTTIERDIPVPVQDIQGEFLRERIVKNGCCGEKELIKLEAWTLTDYPIVVLLDLDTLLLKPLDRLFDFLLDSSKVPYPDDLLRPNTTIPETVNFLYTTDYAMVSPNRKVKPTQGGFVILRPSLTIYHEFVDIVRTGDFRESGGWLGKSGKFWGAMTGWFSACMQSFRLFSLHLTVALNNEKQITVQGLLPLYFQILHPGTSVELNWCVWDNMASPSRDGNLVNGKPNGTCFTQQENCEDCRNRPIADVALAHFTVCQKPWLCMAWRNDAITDRLCRAFHHAWFQERSALEQSWGRSGYGDGTWDRDHNFGNCRYYGAKGYHKIELPYGMPV